MNTKLLIFSTLLVCNLTFGQATLNQSAIGVQSFISNPIPAGGSEIFRFRAGLVTQLDLGNNFDLTPTSPLNSRWFSIGSLNTGSQTVCGLRFQDRNKGLVFGYEDIANPNPRIQWIGTGAGLGNFEFRVANSFNSTVSTLVATMTRTGTTIFGSAAGLGNDARVSLENSGFTNGLFVDNIGINGVSINNSGQRGLLIQTNQLNALGFEIITNGDNPTGGRMKTTGNQNNTGLALFTSGGESSTGIFSNADAASLRVIAIRGRTNGQALFEASIYGETPQINGSQWAGFFDGQVFASSGFTPSDAKLKENIKQEENVLERLSKLTAVTYNFKNMTELNLPKSTQHGFIAQELAEVFLELTQDIAKPVFDKDGKSVSTFEFKSVNYTGLISVLTAAVNELNSEVKLLKEEVESLRNSTDSERNSNSVTSKVILEQNIPNPFSDRTTIKYQIPQGTAKASLIIFDMNGGIKKEFPLTDNKGEITVSASQIGQGLFIYSLVQNGQLLATKKMIIQ